MLCGKWVAYICSEFAAKAKKDKRINNTKTYNKKLISYVNNRKIDYDCLSFVDLDDKFILARKNRFKVRKIIPKDVMAIASIRSIWIRIEVMVLMGRNASQIAEVISGVPEGAIIRYMNFFFNVKDRDYVQLSNYINSLSSLSLTEVHANRAAFKKGRSSKRDIYAFHSAAFNKTMLESAILAYIGVVDTQMDFSGTLKMGFAMVFDRFHSSLVNENISNMKSYGYMTKTFGDMIIHEQATRGGDDDSNKKLADYIDSVRNKKLPYTKNGVPILDRIPELGDKGSSVKELKSPDYKAID